MLVEADGESTYVQVLICWRDYNTNQSYVDDT